ncbi:MAG: DUF6157 family protein [Nocardioides sp.]|uniref:DUF6157 family protein n=1 Tax=Nocardioides sp. TaxID=35761 RepID=UPI0039E341BD
MGTTNYVGAFIRVAEDCPVAVAEVPAETKRPTVAFVQYRLVSKHPYEFTSDDVLFEVHAIRHEIAPEDRDRARAEFFAKPQACLRTSPLGKRYGWGIHHDAGGRVALVPLGSEQYDALAADRSLRQLRAMRSRRA